MGAAMLFTACKKEADLPLYSTGKAPVLTSSVTSVAPAPADSNNTVLTLSWTNPEFAVDTNLYKYIVQIDSAGRNFSKAYSRQVNAQLSTSFIAKELNNALVAFGFAFGRPVTIEVRVIASYANNNDRKISNTLTLQATPYSSSNCTICRAILVLACPRKPRKRILCPDNNARSVSGITVSSYPRMPGKGFSFACILRIRFSRISSLTERDLYPAFFSSPSVLIC